MPRTLRGLDDKTLEAVVTEAHDEIGRHLREQGEMVSSYVGPFYEGVYSGRGRGTDQRTTQTGYQANPSNTHYSWVSMFLSRVAAGVPTWDVEAAIPGHPGMVADALTLGLERVSNTLKLRRFVARMATDYAFSFCYASVMMEERKPGAGLLDRRDDGGAAGLWWPVPRHYEPEDAIWDTSVDAWEEGEFHGVRRLFSLSTAKADGAEAGWDVDEVERAALIADERDAQIPERARRKYRDRDVFAGRVLWFPRLTVEEAEEAGWSFDADEKREMDEALDHHGFIVTLGDKGHAGHLKRPEPYYGCESGPFVMACGVPVPGSTVGLSHLAAIETQSRELNDWRRAVNKAGRDSKTIVAVEDDEDGELKRTINEAAHGDAVDFKTLTREGRPTFAMLDFSTLSNTMYAHDSYLQEQYDRAAGMPDPAQGVVSGDATATEITAAVGAGDLRLGYHIEQFNACMSDLGELMAHQMYHRKEFSVSLVGAGSRRSRLVARAPGGEIEPAIMPVWDGGPEEGVAFDDLHIRFNFLSTQHQTAQARQARGQRIVETLERVAPLMPQAPWIRWQDFMEDLAAYWDEPGMAHLVDEDVLAEATRQFAQIQAAQSLPNGQFGSDAFGSMRGGGVGDAGTFRTRQSQPQGAPVAPVGQPGVTPGGAAGMTPGGAMTNGLSQAS